MDDRSAFLQSAAPLRDYVVKTASHDTSKEFLKQLTNKSAISIFIALQALYGKDFVDWEPETLWLSLKRDGIETDAEDRHKIQAAITLQHNPSFFWDNIVFQRTVQAFSDEITDPDTLYEPNVCFMSWVVYQAAVLRRLDTRDDALPEFDEDVQAFVAVCLRRQGLVHPPAYLDFAEEVLEQQWPKENASFKHEVKDAWNQLDKDRLESTEFAENSIGVQLAKLAGCYLFVKDKTKELFEEIAQLRTPVSV